MNQLTECSCDIAMNDFNRKVQEVTGSTLAACNIAIVQANIGLRCINSCAHCHLVAGPERNEMMDWKTMQLILDVAHKVRPELVDITGGAPEMNHLLPKFVSALRKDGHNVQMRTSLTLLLEPGMEEMIGFYRDAGVRLVASLPCYTKRQTSIHREEIVPTTRASKS